MLAPIRTSNSNQFDNKTSNSQNNNTSKSSTSSKHVDHPEHDHNFRQVSENRYEDDRTGKRYDSHGDLIDE